MNSTVRTAAVAATLALLLAGCSAGTAPDAQEELTQEELDFVAEVTTGVFEKKVRASELLSDFYLHLVAISDGAGDTLDTVYERQIEALGGPIPETAAEMDEKPAELLSDITLLAAEASGAEAFFDFSGVSPANEILTHMRVLAFAEGIAELPAGTRFEFPPEEVVVDGDRAEIDMMSGIRVLPDGEATPLDQSERGQFFYVFTFDESSKPLLDAASYIEMLS